MVGGNANKKMVVSEETQRRLDKIFADSDSEDEGGQLNEKLDQMERADAKREGKEQAFKFNQRIQPKEFKCPVKAGTAEDKQEGHA